MSSPSIGWSRYMFRARKTTKSIKTYKEEDTEDDLESSEATESSTSSGSSSYKGKNSIATANGSVDNTTSSNVQRVDNSARIDFDKSADFCEPLNETLENNAAIDSGYCNDSTVSTSTDVGDENLPIGSIDWFTNFANVIEQTPEIGTIDWYMDLEKIANAQVTNDSVDRSPHQINDVDWCTNFEDVETSMGDNHPFNENLQIVAPVWCPTDRNLHQKNDFVDKSLENVDNSEDKNGNTNENFHEPQNEERNFKNLQIQNDRVDKNFKIEAIEWPTTKFGNVETKNDLVEAKSDTIEWLSTSEDVQSSPEKNSKAFNVPKPSYDLPLKKRSWRYVENLQSHRRSDAIVGKSIVDRLHDRLVYRSSVEPKPRKKFRDAKKGSRKTKFQTAEEIKENVHPSSHSSLNSQQSETKMANENQLESETIKIDVDPRITQDHRKYFDCLLNNIPSLFELINRMDNSQLL
ncbi:uncharacterized protein [Venturia canescens]|nr:uncharacterized protein LOC122407790 isoform X2 [Venturia canescens]